MYSKRVVIPTSDNDKDIIHTYMNRYFLLNKLQLALHTRLQQLLSVILQNFLCLKKCFLLFFGLSVGSFLLIVFFNSSML